MLQKYLIRAETTDYCVLRMSLPEPDNSEIPTKPPARRSIASPLRLIIYTLLAILVVGALWYQFGYSRPKFEQAKKDLEAVSVLNSRQSGEPVFSNNEIRKLLGMEPRISKQHRDGLYLEEEYHWPEAIPGKSNFVSVLYKRYHTIDSSGKEVDKYLFTKLMVPNTRLDPQNDLPAGMIEIQGALLEEAGNEMAGGGASAGRKGKQKKN